MECLEDPLTVVGRDARAVISDRHAYRVVDLCDADLDRPIRRVVLHRVVDQVRDDLFDPHRVDVCEHLS